MHEPPGNERDSAPKAGDVIAGRFVVEEILGTGAMGIVVAARSIALKRRVAVKLVKIGAEGYARFEREAVALASLESDHIVRVLEYGTGDDGSPYLVMEFLVGRDLLQELRARGRLPIDEAVDCILEACLGLSEAHARGIVHRDIKPGNLFLVDRGGEPPRLKILDFGISKILSPADSDLSLTEASTTLGSPAYMSPEQVRLTKSVDHRADIWSLGVVLHRLVTGKQPFVGDGFSAICAAVATDAPPRLREDRPDAPMALERVVVRCLEKDPARRYSTIAELAAALVPFATARGRSAAARIAKPVAPVPDVRSEPEPVSEEPQPSEGIGADTGSPAVVGTQAAPAGRALPWRTAFAIGAGLVAVIALTLVVAPSSPSSPVTPPMTAVAAQPRAAVVAPPPAPSVAPAAVVTAAPPPGAPAPPAPTPAASSRVAPPAARRPALPAPTPVVTSTAPNHDPPPPFGGKALQSRE